jgi:putative peptide zinc metalloprotease protein
MSYPKELTAAPRLADGVELIGRYENSGFKETPYLARRADGQVVQLSRLLYLIASQADGLQTAGQIAQRVSHEFGRTVTSNNVWYLVEKRLRPLGVLARADGSSPELPRSSPILALQFRAPLVPEGAARVIGTLLRPLFLPPVVVAVLLGLAAVDAWLFFAHGLLEGVRVILYRPELFLIVLGLTALSGAFHECGHAAACRYGGARPGAIGVGIYLVWPVFYTDVTDTYRLGRIGRLRADLGGVYFNAIFSLAIAAAYFATGAEYLLLVVVLQQIEILYQFLPFIMLDGYYVVSDLSGVPDLFGRIKPILKSILPGRETDERVEELKPWVRVVVTAWVVTVVPALLYLFAMLVMSAPLIFATARDAVVLHYGEVRAAFGDGRVADGATGLLRMVLLVIPAVGVILTLALVGKRLGAALLDWPGSKGETLVRSETLVDLYFRDLFGRRNLDSANEIIAPDCTVHDPSISEEARGPEGVRRHIAARRAAIPEDARFTAGDKVVEGDKVTVCWTAYRGARDDKGAAPNEDGATSTRVTSFRIADGKIAEIWEDYDVMGDLHAPDNSEEGQGTLPSLRVIAGALGAYVGVPAALLYPVSLVAFALQLMVSEQLGFLTAWYAASLIPTTIIWGQAITVLLIPLCASFMVALAAAHFRVWRRLEVRKEASRIPEELGRRTRRKRLSVAGIVLLLAVMAVVVLWFVPVPFFPGFASTLSLTLAVLVGWWGGTSIADDYVRYTNKPERAVLLGKHWIWRGIEEGWIFGGLSWVYFGSALGATLSVLAVGAFGQGPDLPRVIMSSSGEGVETPNEVPLLLLSHSGGYWHVLNSGESEGTKGGRIREGTLSSVPNSEAGDVVVIDDPVADLSLTAEGPRDDVAWAGTMLTYELKVTNNGPDAATGVELANRMPKDAAPVSVTTSRGTCDSKVADGTRSTECELGNLPEEGTATVRIEIEPKAAGSLFDTATVKSEDFDYYGENSKEASNVEVKLDTTAPETRPILLPKANPRGWNKSDVSVSLEAEDHEGSGVEKIVYSASGAQEIEEKTSEGASAEVSLTSEGKMTIYYSAEDFVGNTEEKASVTVGIDRTGPDVDCDGPDDLWHKEEVSIPCAASDSISGLRDATNANFFLSTEHARERIEDGEEDDNASTNSREICDAAGNCRTAGPIGGLKIDKKQPAIKIIAPADDGEYKLKEHVEANYVCIDGGSGVDECHGSVMKGSGLDTSSVGLKAFNVKAEDNAGNITSESRRYGVIYDFTSDGPIHLAEVPSRLHVVEAGGTVLVGFGLGGYRASDVFAAGYPNSREIECPKQGPRTFITKGTAQFTRPPDSDRYTYAWDTEKSWSGTCRQLVLKLNDGTEHMANFEFTD